MYAIVEDSGTQIRVAQGDVIDIDIRELGEAESFTFDRVLVVGNADDNTPATIGEPYVTGASVTAEVIEEFKDRKIDVIKFKRRKGYRRKQGHRQRLLKVKITNINT